MSKLRKKTHFNLKQFFDGLIHERRQELHQANIRVILNCPSNLELDADQFRLSQVFLNLFNNAINYAKDGEIRINCSEKNNRIKQSVSLPNIHFEDIVNESWENSTLKQYLELTRYLFVVLKKTTDFHYKLVGAKFWSITDSELETKVKDAWIETVNTIKHGVELNRDLQTNRVTNNFINASARRIIHVRPRADKSSYMAYNPNADKLPVPANWKNKPDNYSDDWMTRQCFWINNTYIEKQVSDFFD